MIPSQRKLDYRLVSYEIYANVAQISLGVKKVTFLTSVLTCGAANAELPLQANLFPRGR